MYRRGEIYYADFGEHGETSKQSGIRPAVIVSNNRANVSSPVITVVPLTTRVWKKRHLPTHVQIKGGDLEKPSMVLAEQVATMDKKSLGVKIGEITEPPIMNAITMALQIQLGVYEEYN